MEGSYFGNCKLYRGWYYGDSVKSVTGQSCEGRVCLRLVCRAWLRADTVVPLSRGEWCPWPSSFSELPPCSSPPQASTEGKDTPVDEVVSSIQTRVWNSTSQTPMCLACSGDLIKVSFWCSGSGWVRGSPLLTGSPGMPSAVSSQAEKWPREIQPRPSSPGIGLLLCTSLLPCVTVHDPKSHVTQVSQTSNKLGHQWRFLKRFVLPGEAELVSGWENAVKKKKKKKKIKQTNRDNEKFDNVPNETKHRALGLFPPIVFSGATLSLGWHTGHRVCGVCFLALGSDLMEACKKCGKSTSD